MVIFKNYTTSNVLFDEPYEEVGRLKLYPVKVKDYNSFDNLLLYLLFSKKHYELNNNINLFEYVVAINIARYDKEKKEEDKEKLLYMVLKDLEELFSIVCRENIYHDKEELCNNNVVILRNKDNTIRITKGNYEKIRQIVLKQNGIKEPTIFENKIEEQLASKYMKAMQKKNKGNLISELGDMANFVSCYTGKSYEELYNQNVLQLQCDFCRCVSMENYKTSVLYSTVSDKAKVTMLTENIVPKLFEDPYKDMWKDMNSIGFLQ